MSGQRQVLTYAVIRQAVKAAALRLGVDPAKFSLHSFRGPFVDDMVHGKAEVSTGVCILSNSLKQQKFVLISLFCLSCVLKTATQGQILLG